MIVISFWWLVPFSIVLHLYLYLSYFLFSQIFIPYTSFLLSDICLIQFFPIVFIHTFLCYYVFRMSLKRMYGWIFKKYNLVWDTGELSYCGGKPVLLKAFQLAYCLNLFFLFGRKFLSEKYKMPMSNSSKETET